MQIDADPTVVAVVDVAEWTTLRLGLPAAVIVNLSVAVAATVLAFLMVLEAL